MGGALTSIIGPLTSIGLGRDYQLPRVSALSTDLGVCLYRIEINRSKRERERERERERNIFGSGAVPILVIFVFFKQS